MPEPTRLQITLSELSPPAQAFLLAEIRHLLATLAHSFPDTPLATSLRDAQVQVLAHHPQDQRQVSGQRTQQN